jgi:hypothetical protein
MWEYYRLMLEIHQAKTLLLENDQINFILHWGIVTRLFSHQVQVLPSSTTLRHSTGHQAWKPALVVLPKDI